MLDLGKEIIFFGIVEAILFVLKSIFVRNEIVSPLCYLNDIWVFLFIYFFYFLSCVFRFLIFLVCIFLFGCWEKWGTRKKKKFPNFSRFSILIFLELFCSRKKNPAYGHRRRRKRVAEKFIFIESVLQVIVFSVLKNMRDVREWG